MFSYVDLIVTCSLWMEMIKIGHAVSASYRCLIPMLFIHCKSKYDFFLVMLFLNHLWKLEAFSKTALFQHG